MSSRLDRENVIGRFAGFYFYDHAEDRAILAWLAEQEKRGLSKSQAVKKALYSAISGRGDTGDTVRAIDALRGDVADLRAMLRNGVLVQAASAPPGDDVSDVADALASFDT